MDHGNNKSQSLGLFNRFNRFVLSCIILLVLVGVAAAEMKSSFQDCPDSCYLPEESGPCYALFQRWHFDVEKNECFEFTFGGCGGNANNFQTMKECINFGSMCMAKCSRKPSG